MSLTKVTSPVLEQDLRVKSINGAEFSVFSKPNSIPIGNAAGKIDSSWGVSSGGGSSGNMDRSTYDTNSDGKVNASDTADKIGIVSTANKVWGTNASNVQGWLPYLDGDMKKDVYDTNGNGTVDFAEQATAIAGNPGANKIYGTDALGNKGFFDVSAGFMRLATYDTNSDGKVNASDTADRIYGNPVADQFYGTDTNGNQGFFSKFTFLLKSEYDINGDGKVDAAEIADAIAGNPGANRYYGTNNTGTKGWYVVDALSGGGSSSGDMLTSVYDIDKDGIVDKADEAIKVFGIDTASNKSVYGKNSAGVGGFFTVTSLCPELMTTTDWVDTFDGVEKIKLAAKADSITSDNAKFGTFFGKTVDGTGWRGWTGVLHGAKLLAINNILISDSTITKVNWTIAETDPYGIVSSSNSRIDIPARNDEASISSILRANITAYIQWEDNSIGEREMFIRINGTDVFSVSASTSGQFKSCYLHIPFHSVMQGDYIEIYVKQDSGTDLSILPGSFFIVQFV